MHVMLVGIGNDTGLPDRFGFQTLSIAEWHVLGTSSRTIVLRYNPKRVRSFWSLVVLARAMSRDSFAILRGSLPVPMANNHKCDAA